MQKTNIEREKTQALQRVRARSNKPPNPLLAIVYIRPRIASLLKEKIKRQGAL